MRHSRPFRARYGAGAEHALVRDHYVTGRPLVYLAGGFMDHVSGMDLGRAAHCSDA